MLLLLWLGCGDDASKAPEGDPRPFDSGDSEVSTAPDDTGTPTDSTGDDTAGTDTTETDTTETDTTETATDDTADSATTTPECVPAFAAKAARFDLPASGADPEREPWGALASGDGAACASGGDWSHHTEDVDGDAVLDVVIASDACRDTAIGGEHWEVYPGTGAGFATAATTWPLPAEGLDPEAQPWIQTTQLDRNAACAAGGTGGFWHEGRDVDGDGLTDLLILENGCDDPTTGQDHWIVWLESGAGFPSELRLDTPDVSAATGATPWTPWDGEDLDCADGSTGAFAYDLADLDGDGWIDVLVTRNDCEDVTIGEDHWVWYRGNGAGFDPGVAVSLPDLGAAPGTWPWGYTQEQSYDWTCATGPAGGWTYSWEDLTGDGLLDIIVTWNDCDDPTVGADHWTVLAGNGAGFDPPARVDLPTIDFTSDLPTWWAVEYSGYPGRCSSGGSGDWGHTFDDMDGDAIPDLVLTQYDCADDTVGRDHWLVHLGTGSGYGPAARIDLPDAQTTPTENPWARSGQRLDCTHGRGDQTLRYELADMDADGLVDLVVTQNPCDDTTIGQDHWLVYLAECTES